MCFGTAPMAAPPTAPAALARLLCPSSTCTKEVWTRQATRAVQDFTVEDFDELRRRLSQHMEQQKCKPLDEIAGCVERTAPQVSRDNGATWRRAQESPP